MGTNKLLTKLKREYLRINPSQNFLNSGWDGLVLPDQKKGLNLSYFLWRGAVAFAVMLVVLIYGLFNIIQVSLASLPGEPLYPVKRLYESVVYQNPDQKKDVVEIRAREIIEVVKKGKDGEVLENLVTDYNKTIGEARSNSDKGSDELRKSLKKHKETFREIVEDHSESRTDLDRAIDEIDQVTEGGNQENKGNGNGKGGNEENEEDNSGKENGSEDSNGSSESGKEDESRKN